jgi:hypothetical protein
MKGCPYDNAVAESIFKMIKAEFLRADGLTEYFTPVKASIRSQQRSFCNGSASIIAFQSIVCAISIKLAMERFIRKENEAFRFSTINTQYMIK